MTMSADNPCQHFSSENLATSEASNKNNSHKTRVFSAIISMEGKKSCKCRGPFAVGIIFLKCQSFTIEHSREKVSLLSILKHGRIHL